MRWGWIIAAALLLVAAGSVWVAFQSPSFVAGLASIAAAAAWKAMAPAVAKRMPPEDEARWRECVRKGGRWNHRTRKCD